MVQVNWTLQAIQDLKNIAEYFSKESKIYAKRKILASWMNLPLLKLPMPIHF